MRKNMFFAFLIVLFFTIGCTSVTPNAGEEGVIIRKPMIFGHGGVDPDPVKTGRKWVAITTNSVIVNMQPQQNQIHLEDLMSKDGVPLDFDSVIRLRVTDSVKLIIRFGPRWFENNIQAEFINRIRQAVRKHGMNETAIDTKAIEDIDREVSEAMREYIKKAELPVELIEVTVGRANPPDAVKSQRIATAEQEQRANTEKQRKMAEIQRKDAEIARASADNAFRNAMNLTPEQYLQLEQIKAQREVCVKEGANCSFVFGGAMPTINMSKK